MKIVALAAFALLQIPSAYAPHVESPKVGAECDLPGGGSDVCTNFLPANWNSEQMLPSVPALLDTMVDASHYAAGPRKASRWCNLFGNEKDKALTVKYTWPKDLYRYPGGKVDDRDLVVAVFVSETDENCWEFKYGVRKRTDDWTRVAQFTTVRPNGAGHDAGRDVKNGTWITWSLSTRVVDGVTHWRREKLEDGPWVSCKGDHGSTSGGNFIGCHGIQILSQTVGRGPFNFTSLSDALVRYKARDPDLLAYLKTRDVDSFVDAAWARCGKLGCCSAE